MYKYFLMKDVRKDDWGVPGGLCGVNQPISNATIR